MFPSGSSDNLRTAVINVCFHKQVSQIETVTEIRSSFLAGFRVVRCGTASVQKHNS